MSSPVKKKVKRGAVKFKEFVLACETLSLIYGFKGEEDKIQWDYKKNGDILPEHVSYGSHKECWFWCPECKHSNQKRLDLITNHANRGCGFCAGKVRCQRNGCMHCYKTSFANAAHIKPKRAKHLTNFKWSAENELKPWMVSAFDNSKYKFNCIECKHTIDYSPNYLMSGYGCGYCRTGSKLFCGDGQCQHCLNRSVAGNSITHAIWATERNREELKLEAHTTARCSHKKCYWICPNQDEDGTFHMFQMSANDVANGHGCSECKYKTEKKVKDFLREQFGTTLVGAKLVSKRKYDWCVNPKTRFKLEYDIILVLADGSRIIIEVDGQQHYERVKHFNRDKSLEDIQKRDRYKEKRALENGYSVIRLKQVDVWLDQTDWQTILSSAISLCQTCDGNIVETTY